MTNAGEHNRTELPEGGESQSGSAATSAAADTAALDLKVLSGNPSVTELAAVTAVLNALLEEREELQRLDAVAEPSEWDKTQRPLRATIIPGVTRWRSFSG